MGKRYSRHGFTVVEMLIALAIIGVLAGIGAVAFREPPARLAANSYQSFLQNARHLAISTNRPVLLEADADARAVTMLISDTSANVNCPAFTQERGVFDASEYRRVTFESDMPDSRMLWLPNGRPLRCGGGITESTMSFSDGNRMVDVHVSAAGQVRVEFP